MEWKKIKEGKKEYYLPSPLPETSSDFFISQRNKKYLTPSGEVRIYPERKYDNGSYVCDEYLYLNYQWKLIDEQKNYPKQLPEYQHKIIENKVDSWIDNGRVIEKTYTVYTIIDNPPYANYLGKLNYNVEKNNEDMWEIDGNNIIVTFTVTEKTDFEKVESRNIELNHIRQQRNKKLEDTDFYHLISIETGKSLHSEFLEYRQWLRDIPQTHDIETELVWRDIPNNIFVEV